MKGTGGKPSNMLAMMLRARETLFTTAGHVLELLVRGLWCVLEICSSPWHSILAHCHMELS